ncbi:hypothetical protein LR48_Vigan97s000300 [Vigna angularis]|uniref:Uncharacterized protein n=1 Tax=Phaseolus angularis TaxID=3914 RepID=A0A0L9T3Z7_PHAAN|nr:hypothetical protein LR48_Vigan97s000300 [Vigna angularis]
MPNPLLSFLLHGTLSFTKTLFSYNALPTLQIFRNLHYGNESYWKRGKLSQTVPPLCRTGTPPTGTPPFILGGLFSHGWKCKCRLEVQMQTGTEHEGFFSCWENPRASLGDVSSSLLPILFREGGLDLLVGIYWTLVLLVAPAVSSSEGGCCLPISFTTASSPTDVVAAHQVLDIEHAAGANIFLLKTRGSVKSWLQRACVLGWTATLNDRCSHLALDAPGCWNCTTVKFSCHGEAGRCSCLLDRGRLPNWTSSASCSSNLLDVASRSQLSCPLCLCTPKLLLLYGALRWMTSSHPPRVSKLDVSCWFRPPSVISLNSKLDIAVKGTVEHLPLCFPFFA